MKIKYLDSKIVNKIVNDFAHHSWNIIRETTQNFMYKSKIMDVSLKTQQKQDASSHDLYSPEERKRKKGRKRRRKTAREKWTIYYQTHFITNATEAVSYRNFSRVRCFKNCFEQKLLGAILTFSFSKTVKSRFYSILMFPLSRPIYNKISFVF